MSYVFIILGMIGAFFLFLSMRINKHENNYITNSKSEKDKKSRLTITLRRFSELIRILHRDTIGIEKKEKVKSYVIILMAISLLMAANYIYSIFSIYIAFPVSLILIINLMHVRNKKIRKKQFEIEFLEALNIINSVISSGSGILQAIDICGSKIDGIVGREFQTISQRLSYGEDAKAAFMQSYDKLPFKEYYFFVTIVLNNLNSGGQLKKAMSNIITTITNSRIMEKKKISKTAEVRTSIKVLSAIPCFFLFFLKYQNPEGFKILTDDPLGQILFYYSIGSVVIGILILWSMMNKI